MRKFLLWLIICLSLSLEAQNSDSFLCVDDFRILGPEHTFILPDGMRKTDNNGKPWAMVKIVAKGFDSKILNDISFYSPSSTLTVGNASIDANDGSYKIILSSGVKGKLVFKYQGTTLEYQMPMQLTKNRVYQLDLVMRSANLTIVATPAESKIFVDGQEVGHNGFASVNLSMGEHNYSVECDDYLAEKNKTIILDKNETLTIDLQPLFGYLTVTSVPEGADVFINGLRSGTTPYLLKKIKRGANNIEVKLNGYYDYAEYVEITIGETKNIEVNLAPYGVVSPRSGNKIAAEPTLRLSQDTLFFESDQSIDSVFITTNSLEWDFMDVPYWLSVYKRNNVLAVTCLKNRVHRSRESDIVVYTGDLTKKLHVFQEEGKTVLKSIRNNIEFEAQQDSAIRIIETNVTNWDITTSDSWISAYEMGDSLVVICEANPWPVSRYGTIDITAFDEKTSFEITQKSHESHILVPKDDVVIESFGGSMAIPVGNDADTWTCSSNDEWLSVTHSGDAVLLECTANETSDRRGSFVISTDTKTYKVNVLQKGTVKMTPVIVVNSKPSWALVYIDGKKAGRTPLSIAADDSVRVVRLGREHRSHLFNSHAENIQFNTGMRYLEATISGETCGLRSGFIGVKRWGGYNHFQLRLNNWDLSSSSTKSPLYIMSLGPTYEIMPWLSAYVGFGVMFSNDTLRSEEKIENKPIQRNSLSDVKMAVEGEAGLMFYYKRVFVSLGLQLNNIGLDKQNIDFSAGLGMYFNRYYDKNYGYCATRSRRWWSLNLMYNPGRNGYGFMFSDIGKNNLRYYIKAMSEWYRYDTITGEDPNVETVTIDEINPGLTAGVVFNIMPGYIDVMMGGGYQVSMRDGSFETKGVQAEAGFVLNVWRIPLTIMMRCCELEKDTRYLTVDFGVGFSFGELFKW